jgi:hypothetical protein
MCFVVENLFCAVHRHGILVDNILDCHLTRDTLNRRIIANGKALFIGIVACNTLGCSYRNSEEMLSASEVVWQQ